MIQPYAARTHEKMREVLMDPNAAGPAIHYYMIRGGDQKRNITVWESGTVGAIGGKGAGEYIKSYGHYHIGKLDEMYTVLAGEGYVIMQVRKTSIGPNGERAPIDDQIESFRAVRVKAGDSVFIPAGAGHLAINTGSSWLVTSDDSPVNFEERDPVSLPGHADYEPFKRLHGAAYYLIERDGKPEFVKNPNYKTVPPVDFA